MSRSFDLCVKRASNSKHSNYADRDWSQAEEVESEKFFKVYEEYLLQEGIERNPNIEIIFNPNVKLDYFTSCCLCHDGTTIFESYAFYKCVQEIVDGTTYYTMKDKPKSNIRYTVGNFVQLNEFGDFGGYGYMRTTVLLPIKYETW